MDERLRIRERGGFLQGPALDLDSQDAVVRRILLDYYGNSTDLLDKDTSRPKVWEIAFLTAVFPLLGRQCAVQSDNVIYHLDYHERPSWDLEQPEVAARSVARARELAEKYLPPGTTLSLQGSA